ncbi:MAG: BMP family ABC transporter substrate-binding protein [Halanaerobium sp.]
MRLKITLILLFILFFSFAASAQYLEVALISDIGGFEDNSYNQQLRDSLNKADENLNLSLEFRESKLMSEYLENINYYAEDNVDLIWGVGFTMEQAIKEAAQMYTDINFVIFDGTVEEENVMSLSFKKDEEAFLAGVIAALETSNSAVAFIGGKDNREIKEYQQGFETGVKAVNSEIEVYNEFVGSFNDFSKAKEVTNKLIGQNVDIIFYAAGAASRGIIDTSLEEDIKLISLDSADIELAPENVLTAVLKNTDYLVEKTVESFLEDDYVNEIKKYGLSDDAFIIDQSQAEDMMTEENIDKIEEYKQQYLSGEIEMRSLQ